MFSVAFGRNLDAHEPQGSEKLFTAPSFSRQCLEGKQCYVDTLHITIAACSAALLLSVWAGWRDRQRIAALERSEQADTIWDEEEED